MRGYRKLTTDELEAVCVFAGEHGRRWRTILNNVYWPFARIYRAHAHDDTHRGMLLHGLRNSHGPTWLASFRLPKVEG